MTSNKTLLLIIVLVTSCGGGGGSVTVNGNTTYSFSGTVSSSSGSLQGVTIKLTGTNSATTTTDASGNYNFTGLVNGSYTVTPNKTGYTFSPVNKVVTISGSNSTGNNFTASVITYSISGTVSGTITSGVTITLTGNANGTTTTDKNGNYSFSNLSNGNYTVTPTLAGCTFSPSSISVTVTNTNVTGQNFTDTVTNIMSITVNGALCSSSNIYGINKPCVSVTVCSPGTSTCQTINDIVLDTGASGLRIFKQALTVTLTQQTIGSGYLAECMQYADGSSNWGPVQIASVILGGEPSVQIPIQVIDSTFFSTAIPSGCQNTDISPSADGYNGFLGVGLFAQDCGSSCLTTANNGFYFSCSGKYCNDTAIPLSSQVQNPVALLPKDNNGVIVELPSISANGELSVNGSLILGIDTQSNNTPPSTVTAYPVDGSTGDFITSFNGNSYPSSFIDSGSNALFFPATSATPECTGTYSGWFCPTSNPPLSLTPLSATTSGYTGTPSSMVSFQIGNFSTLFNSSNWVFDDIGGLDPNEFDWGLPFYFGRNVYHGIEGTSSSLGIGPCWAY